MRGTVQKYGPTWRIRYDAGLRPNGQRDQRSKGGFRTKRAAQEALQEALELVRTGMVTDARKVTVADYLHSWLASKHNLRPTTRRAYEGHIRVYLIPSIGHYRLAALRAEHLDAMYDAIRRGEGRPSPGVATLRRIHSTLRSALQTAYKRRLISFNPAGQVSLESEPRRQREVWDPPQLATFLHHAAADRLSPAYHFLAHTGVRRGELCGLRWSDIDLEAATATIRRQLVQSGRELIFGEPKTKSGARVIPLDTGTVAVLRRHKATQATERLAAGTVYQSIDLVFCREDGSPLHPEYVSRRFKQLCVAAGVPVIVLHGLRHTHATHALAAGVELTVVQRRLGHSTLALTSDTYTRVLPEVARDAAERVAEMVRRAAAAGGQTSYSP